MSATLRLPDWRGGEEVGQEEEGGGDDFSRLLNRNELILVNLRLPT